MARPKKNAAQAQDTLLTLDTVPEIPVEEQPSPLPKGWKWVYWGDCGDFIAGNVFKPAFQGKKGLLYPFYKVGSLKYLDREGYICDTENSINREIQEHIKSSIIPRLSLIFAKIGESIRINRRGINKIDCCIDNNLIAFIPKKIILRYAYYWSLHIDLYKYTNATTVPAIRKSDLKKIQFPLASIEVQQRIVERIESLFAKLDEAREKAESALESFERRKAAILHKAFTGKLTAHSHVSSKWKDKSAEELFTYVTSGSRGWAKYYAERGSIFIRMGNLSHKSIELDFSNIQYVLLPHKAEGQRTRLQKNDILISITADIGMVGLFRDDTAEAYINQHIALARPSTNENAEFIAWYLISDVGLSQLKKKQRGTTKVGLGLDDIRSIHLKMPSLSEQQEIVRILDRIFAREQQAREAAENVLQRIDQMKKAILARAFRGELV